MSILPEFRTLKHSKKRINKKTKKPLGRLKLKLDEVFGEMIMARDAGQLCYSCGKAPGTQPGHFMRRGLQATRCHPDNVHSQCFRCNCVENGNQLEYAERLDERYGPGKSQYLRDLSRKSWKQTYESVEKLIEAAKLGAEAYAEIWSFYGSEQNEKSA